MNPKKTNNLEKPHHKRKADCLSLEEKRGERKNLEKECKRASYVMYTKPTPVLVTRVTLRRSWCRRRQLSLLVGALDLISHGVNDISKTLISSSPSPPWPTHASPNPNFSHQLSAPLSGNLELLMDFIVFGGKK